MNAYDAMEANEGTISYIKITRVEAMSAHKFNEICAFLLFMTLKVLSFSQLVNVSRDCSRRHVNFYQIPWQQLILTS